MKCGNWITVVIIRRLSLLVQVGSVREGWWLCCNMCCLCKYGNLCVL